MHSKTPLSPEEKVLLRRLHENRISASTVFKTHAFRRIWRSIIEKYPESVHFIYELLQNADDASATMATVILGDDYLVFKHDGKRQFSVTEEPEGEEECEPDEYGDINSITAVGATTKEDSTNKIGKFGVGFKSVFQITDRPEIYDDKFSFAIEDYIVPVPETAHEYLRSHGETLFFFPFKNPGKTHKEILNKLRNLNQDNPVLFLNNLQRVEWKSAEDYDFKVCSKTVLRHFEQDNIKCELLLLENAEQSSRIWMFSEDISFTDVNKVLPISVGYYLTPDGKNIDTSDMSRKVYCYFPTSETFNTCFITHAPFLLTDSRQQLKHDGSDDENLNRQVIGFLAKLAARTLPILRDIGKEDGGFILNDNIFSIIPIDYTMDDDGEDICANEVFYDEFSEILRKDKLLLSRNHDYLAPDNIRIFSNNKLKELISREQLSFLFWDGNEDLDENEDDEYEGETPDILDVMEGNASDDSEVNYFMESTLGIEEVSPEDIVRSITAKFMSTQKISWVKKFYSFLRNDAPLLWRRSEQNRKSELPVLYAPIVKTTDGRWVSPFVKGGNEPNVFLALRPIKGYNIVSEDLCTEYTMKFLRELGLKEPDKEDYIFKVILEDYFTVAYLERPNSYLKNLTELVSFWKNTDEDKKPHLENRIRECLKIVAKSNDGSNYFVTPSSIYDDTEILHQYFKGYSTTGYDDRLYFADYDYHESLVKKFGKSGLREFFLMAGIKLSPVLCVKYKGYYKLPYTLRSRVMSSSAERTKISNFKEGVNYLLDGFDNAFKNNWSIELSKAMWSWITPDSLKMTYQYSYYGYQTTGELKSFLYASLLRVDWLYDMDGDAHSVEGGVITREDMILAGYENKPELFQVLGLPEKHSISDKPEEDDEEVYKVEETEEETKLRITKDRSVADMKEALALLDEKREKERLKAEREANFKKSASSPETDTSKQSGVMPEGETSKQSKLTRDDFKETRRRMDNSTPQASRKSKDIEDTLRGFDEKMRIEKEEVEAVEALREMAATSERYSYGWFKSLMELEFRANGITDENSGKKSINILFYRIQFDLESARIIELKDASRFVPVSLENVENIPITFYLNTGSTIEIDFDVASVKDESLRLKISAKNTPLLKRLKENIQYVNRAELNMDKPIDLLSKWHNMLEELGYDDEDSLKDGIRPDLKFIFGPPGTGKTTTLAKRITELMTDSNTGKLKILVLAPTNKACDVLTRKLLEMNHEDDTWIWRFIATMDERIEQEEVVYQRESDLDGQDKACVISTMARFSFDGFYGAKLADYPWDYIIIDEASMIPLYQVIMPILQCGNSEIIIAGDPLQIEPIVKIEEWKDENIYSMVNLHDFERATTEPTQFNVEKLNVEYRSIPSIGEVYSKFAYDGKLSHSRPESSQGILDFGFSAKSNNIISFPVNAESMFDPKRLGTSNVQIYSVIFTVEFVKYISENIDKTVTHDVRIGIISPYSAEVQAIDKLCSQTISGLRHVKIQCGTAHGFQGDQCEVVIAVVNPPASGMVRAADKVFINKKNILNVAVSRAMDYFFLIMPDKQYKFFDNMHTVKELGRILTGSGNYQVNTAADFERLIFGDENHIKESSFVTSHQMTNVYSMPDKKYEIRISESSMDIQVNG